MEGIDRYLGVRMAFNPTHVKATGDWLFLMNLTGTAQVYAMHQAGAWPRLLTDYPDRVSGIYAAPNVAGMVLTRDQGGNEHHQFYWMDLTTMDITTLTDNPTAVHEFGTFSPDGTQIAYTATNRTGRDYDVYVMTIARPAETEMVLTTEGSWRVLDWSPDGQELLLKHTLSNAEQSLHRYHLVNKTLQQVTPDDKPAQYLMASRTPDGAIYVLTDYGRDFLGLARIDDQGLRYLKQEDADYDLLALDESGRTLAYSLNREGFSELHCYEVATGSDRLIHAFDQSLILELMFDSTGENLAVTRSGPTHNMNIALVNVLNGMVTQWTYAPMTGLDPLTLIIPQVIRFVSFDGREIPGYLYRPASADKLPVIVSVHGGPESQERPYFNAWYQYLLHHGYALVTPNVRGSTGYGKTYSHLDDRDKRMDSVRDLAHLVQWIRQQPGLDGERIAIMGGSYGGFMVLAGITQYPDLFQAAIDIVGIANLESFLENTSEWRRALREVEYGYLATDREFLRRFSPIHAVDRIQTPLFVVHGANDPRVPLNEAEQMVSALRERQQPVEYRVFADEGHGIVKLKNRLALYPELVEFLDAYLKR